MMAHFAEIDENNFVLRVIVVNDIDCKDQYGKENEAVGALFCSNLFGGEWKQTSYNSRIRKNYAGVKFKYDAKLDAFIPPQPYSSWTLAVETCQWQAPIPYPDDAQLYAWDETTQTWVVDQQVD